MWEVPSNYLPIKGAPDFISIFEDELTYNRVVIGGNTINGIIFGGLLINTYRNSKLPYLYLTASCFFLSSIFGVILGVFQNWYFFCNPYWYNPIPRINLYNSKCPEITGKKDISFTFNNRINFTVNVFYALNLCLYYIAHWLFSFRYFEVAEMFGRQDKSDKAHLRARSITSKISLGVSIFIALTWMGFIINAFFLDQHR
jgi:hypothetical protein